MLSLLDALLGEVSAAFQHEDVRRRLAVAHEELGLELRLREVFNQDSWMCLVVERLDERHDPCLVVLAFHVVLLDEVPEVDELEVGPLRYSSP